MKMGKKCARQGVVSFQSLKVWLGLGHY